jgi:hypothetical protein
MESGIMSKFKNWMSTVVPDAQDVLRRFPLAALCMAAFTLSILYSTNFDKLTDDTMTRLLGGFVLAAYIFVNVTLVGEGRLKPISLGVKILAGVGAFVAVWFYHQLAFLPLMAIGAAILYLGSASFFRQKRDDVAVWDFTHKLWTAVIFTVAGSVIYVAGVFAISGALKSLFQLNIRDLVEDWLLPIGLGFLAPMAWMSMVPRHDDDDADSLRNPGFVSRAVGFLGAWILAPLTMVYALILMAYGVKILLNWSLPNGEIAALVTPFLIVGTLTWLILDPPFIQEKRLARWYSKTWFMFMIPAAVLLAIATFVRINAYGWTIDRYLLVLASIWALGLALWFTLRKTPHHDIRIIPGFAALLLAVASFGPWGADGFSAINQGSRLHSALIANDMLDHDGKLKAQDELIVTDEAAAKRAKGAFRYLKKGKKQHRLERYILADETVTEKRFGLDKVQINDRYNRNDHRQYSAPEEPISISGYNYISRRQNRTGFSKTKTGFGQEIKFGLYTIKNNKEDLVLTKNREELARFNIVTWLREQPADGDGTLELEPRQMLFKDADIEIVFHLMNANFTVDQYQGKFIYAEYFVLAKGVDIGEN